LTWGLYIAPGSHLKAATEKAYAARAVAQVTSASGGAYTFTYVPGIQPYIQWSGSNPPLQIELMRPGYATNPPVDFMFLVLPKGQPTPSNGSLTYPFPQPLWGGADATYWRLGPDVVQRAKRWGHAYMDMRMLAKYPPRDRQASYVWAAAVMTGVKDTSISYTLTRRERADIAAMSQTACQLLSAWPYAAPIGEGSMPLTGHVEYANWIFDEGTWTLRDPASHADMQDFTEHAPWNPTELVLWKAYDGTWHPTSPE
jgi:hypothetical protein